MERDLASLSSKLAALRASVTATRETAKLDTLADADLFQKGLVWALRYDANLATNDVALLKTQLYLGLGRTADARKTADTMNLDNPDRKEIRPMAASIVAEAWARTGKPKEALALLDTIEPPKKDSQQIGMQVRVARIFARFAANQRGPARSELQALADEDVNHLGRFLMPQFRVHPELQKLARRVLEQHPQARSMAKQQAKSQKNR